MNKRQRFFCTIHTFTFDKRVFLAIEGRFKARPEPTSSDRLRSLRLPWKRTIGREGKLSKSGFEELEIMFLLAGGGVELSQL